MTRHQSFEAVLGLNFLEVVSTGLSEGDAAFLEAVFGAERVGPFSPFHGGIDAYLGLVLVHPGSGLVGTLLLLHRFYEECLRGCNFEKLGTFVVIVVANRPATLRDEDIGRVLI